jgi:hypothetical protein
LLLLLLLLSLAEDNSLNYAAILDTAADIARAMMHLHKNQVRPHPTCNAYESLCYAFGIIMLQFRVAV